MNNDDHSQRGPWEPDPRSVGTNWRAMFDQPRGAGPAPAGPPPVQDMGPDTGSDEEVRPPDLSTYRPWLLRRGGSRPSMMLGLRRFDPRSGHWIGWGLSYPSLFEVEYVGDRFLSLDFGMRQFVFEGRGLDELARRIKQGSVMAVLEYAASVWPSQPEGPLVTAIRRMAGKDQDG